MIRKVIVILCILFYVTTAAAASPSIEVDNIIMNPTNPEPLDTITFSISLSEHDGTVHFDGTLLVVECNGKTSICYPKQNISLLGNTLEQSVDVTLTHADATYISYWVSIKDDGSWTDHPAAKLNLTINDNGADGKDTLYLVVIIVIVAMCLIIGYFWLKRLMKKS